MIYEIQNARLSFRAILWGLYSLHDVHTLLDIKIDPVLPVVHSSFPLFAPFTASLVFPPYKYPFMLPFRYFTVYAYHTATCIYIVVFIPIMLWVLSSFLLYHSVSFLIDLYLCYKNYKCITSYCDVWSILIYFHFTCIP